MISVFIETNDSYRPKAVFAIKTMLSAFFVDVHLIEGPESFGGSRGVKIYYGEHTESDIAEHADLIFAALPETAAWFDEFRKYDLSNVHFVEHDYQSVPVFFGRDDQSQKLIYSDIFASAFFLLSDWQRMTAGQTDMHGRLCYSDTVQAALEIPDRPLVNEYALLLREMIQERTGFQPEYRNWQGRKFGALVTHDLDYLRKRYPGTVKRELYDIPVKNALKKSFWWRWNRLKGSIIDLSRPHDRYVESIRKMLDYEAWKGIRPTVLLKSGVHKHARDAADYLDDPFVDEIKNRVDQLDGELGFHSSYNAGFDPQLFRQEKQKLENRLDKKLISHRHHYLRFDREDGLEFLEKQGITVDSTLGWAEQAGYRTGFLHPHQVWDIRNNRPLALLQVPLMLMDMQIFHYMKQNADEGVETAKRQVDLAEKYHGLVVWNFHHITYDTVEAQGCDFLFENSLNYLTEKQPAYLTLGDIYEIYYH